jgi:hypothetical protein
MQAASGGRRGGAPRTLKERLALLECGLWPVAAPKAHAGVRHKTAEQSAAHWATLLGTSFWVGLGCGSALGGLMLLFALTARPADMQTGPQEARAAADMGSMPAPSAWRRLQTYAPAAGSTQAAFAMSLHRGEGGAASLGLRILGVDSPDNVQVLLRDVPPAAELSRGERRDPGTWALRVGELENLQLTLGDGAPDTFDMTIEVATTGGARMARAVAHVRVSEPRSVAAMPAPPVRPVAAGIDGLRPIAVPLAPRSTTSGSSVIEKPFRTEVTALAPAGEPSEQHSAPRPLMPGGMSSLGGPAGDPASASPPPEESRTVWWKLPQPAWAPFANGPGSH